MSGWYRWLRRKGPTFMAVELDLAKADHRQVFVDFGPYSIHAETIDDAGAEPAVILHDCGASVTVTADGPAAEVVRRIVTTHGATSEA